MSVCRPEMYGSVHFRYWLLLMMACPAAMKTSENCPDISNGPPYFNRLYYNLYTKLEEALIKNHGALNNLRAGLVSTKTIPLNFDVRIEAVNVTNVSCGGYESNPAFLLFNH